MSQRLPRTHGKRAPRHYAPIITLMVATLAFLGEGAAQAQADEHASHHPGAVPAPTPAAPAPNQPAAMPAAGGGMADMMNKMMAPMSGSPTPAPTEPAAAGANGAMPGMPAPSGAANPSGSMPGVAPGGCAGAGCGSAIAKTPIYSSLMTLPALTPEKRAEIDALASQQLGEGKARLATGMEAFNRASQSADNAAMQQAVGVVRMGLDEIGAGIAARRVLSEGKAPRNLALDWFKREMNLASPIVSDEHPALVGVTPFHLFTMALLIAFALAMLIMYFFKMRRAAALFGRMDPGSGSPPPGASTGAGGPTPSAAGATPQASDPSPDKSSARVEPAAAQPVTANWRGALRVGNIVAETPTVKTFRLLPPARKGVLPFTFVPGQFLNVAFPIGGERMNRSYSISSSPTQRDYVELTVRREPRGAVSRHIVDLLKVGDEIEAGGPVGRFTFSGTEAPSIVLIAGGVGITPMMSVTRFLTERSWTGDIYFIYACRAPTDFIFAKELAALQHNNPNLHVAVTMSGADGTDWTGPRGRLSKDFLLKAVPNLASQRIHLCGPPTMMEATKTLLADLGVPADHVKTEAFGAVKPPAAAEGSAGKATAPATGPLITFSKHSKSAKIHIDQTILELSEELGIGIEFSCRVGTCGICKTKMTSGEVDMAVQDALDADDKANGIILACQAKPRSDVTVVA